MWENLGRTFAESFRLRKIVDQKRDSRSNSPSAARRHDSRGPFRDVCGLHLGNWELVAYTGKLMGRQFTAVYQRLSNPWSTRRRARCATFFYGGRPLAEDPGDSARALLKTAKSGGYPAFLADLRDDNGAAIPFFGTPGASRPSFQPFSPARPACRFTPGPRSEPHVRFIIRVETHSDPRDRRPRG